MFILLKNRQPKNIVKKLSRGFTLVETIMTVFMFIVLTIGISAVTITIFKSYKQQSQSLSNVDQVTMVASAFTNELRNSAYGNDGSFPLNQAGNSQIIFYSTSLNGNGVVNRIRYYLSGNSLYKGVVTPTGSPLAYNLAEEVTDKIQDNVMNNATTTIPIFYYYDGNYAGTGSALSQPININNVKFVKINLLVLKQPSLSTTTVFYFNIGAAIRNLKNNL